MMTWQRLVVPACVAVGLISAAMSPLAMYLGYWAEARFVLGAIFVVGALVSFRAYWYYVQPGPQINTLVAMLVAKSVMFLLVGVGFVVNALVGPPPETINFYLVMAYVCFSAAAGAKLATGLFILTAVKHNWLGTDVYKWPFSRRARHRRRRQRRQ